VRRHFQRRERTLLLHGDVHDVEQRLLRLPRQGRQVLSIERSIADRVAAARAIDESGIGEIAQDASHAVAVVVAKALQHVGAQDGIIAADVFEHRFPQRSAHQEEPVNKLTQRSHHCSAVATRRRRASKTQLPAPASRATTKEKQVSLGTYQLARAPRAGQPEGLQAGEAVVTNLRPASPCPDTVRSSSIRAN
jgi:hypothetical protein